MTKADSVHSTPRRTASKARPKSAVSKVLKSGFDLVPTRKPRGKLATMSGLAKFDFKPWKREPNMEEGELVPSNEMLTRLGVSCRMAYGIMLLTREHLIAAHGKIDHGDVDKMMADLTDAAERLKGIAYMVETAYLRVLVSSAAAYKQGVKFKGVGMV
jgi:hypothetical protein